MAARLICVGSNGSQVPNADWISAERTGLTFNDATSAAFAMDIDWAKAFFLLILP